ncbi:hypothetical protein BDZ91DRAFT_764398 [Kalaharituber pfeilii]|nr:hypothetical protein BDZ91DRAFT_764398 [Kalaharituber pfeilii]
MSGDVDMVAQQPLVARVEVDRGTTSSPARLRFQIPPAISIEIPISDKGKGGATSDKQGHAHMQARNSFRLYSRLERGRQNIIYIRGWKENGQVKEGKGLSFGEARDCWGIEIDSGQSIGPCWQPEGTSKLAQASGRWLGGIGNPRLGIYERKGQKRNLRSSQL